MHPEAAATRPSARVKPPPSGRLTAFVRDHGFFTALILVAAALRYVVIVAYRPALMLQADAYVYLETALSEDGDFPTTRPVLYPLLFLKPLLAVGDLRLVPIVQHLAILGLAVVLYLLMRRLGVSGWLAALGLTPLLFDGYQLNSEHYLLTETFFNLLVVGALILVMWWKRPPGWAVIVAGTVLAGAVLTRYAGAALIAPAVLYVVTRGGAWRRRTLLGVLHIVGFTVPILIYSLWFNQEHGTGGVTSRSGFFLYGRVTAFAECEGVELSPELRQFCFEEPPDERPRGGMFRIDRLEEFREIEDSNQLLLDFSVLMIREQPLGYAGAVTTDFLRFFDATPPPLKERYTKHWRFSRTTAEARPDPEPVPAIRKYRGSPPPETGYGRFRIDKGKATWLRSYQNVVYTRGPLLALLALLGLIGGSVGRVVGERNLRAESLLVTAAGAALLLIPVMVTVYHFRYVLPSLALFGVGGAVGATALIDRIRAQRG